MSYTFTQTGSEIQAILDRAETGGQLDQDIAAKQDALTFDDEPKAGSDNPVKSGGILTAIERGTVDTARAVLSNEKTTDTAPYLYRINPYGNRVKPCIVGASVGANQTYKPAGTAGTYLGLTVTANADESTTVSGTSTSTGNIGLQVNNNPSYPSVYTKDHIYALYGMPSGVTGARLNRYIGTQLNDYGNGGIRKATASGTTSDAVRVVIDHNNQAYNFTVRPQFIDLTLMLGSAIAEKALEKDLATAGSGIAWLRSYGLLPDGYEAYNAGSIKSVNTSGRKTIGINQWDEQWETGYYDQGVPTSGTGIRSKADNPIRVMPATECYCKCGGSYNIAMSYYDADMGYISNYVVSGGSGAFTTPSNCYYVRFHVAGGYGSTYKGDISINYPAADTTYHACETYTYPTEATDLRGIFKLDGDTIYADGDLYPPSGEESVKYGVLDLGSLTYEYQSNYTRFRAPVTGVKAVDYNTVPNFVCASLVAVSMSDTEGSIDKAIGVSTNGAYIYVKYSAAGTDAAAVKTALSGAYLVYELATPTTETLTPYTEIQQALTTEEWLGSEVPVGQSSEYYKDIVSAIEGIPEAPASNGTYTLKVTVSGGVATYSWEA